MDWYLRLRYCCSILRLLLRFVRAVAFIRRSLKYLPYLSFAHITITFVPTIHCIDCLGIRQFIFRSVLAPRRPFCIYMGLESPCSEFIRSRCRLFLPPFFLVPFCFPLPLSVLLCPAGFWAHSFPRVTE